MELTFGKLGELFTSLSFASALIAMISYYLADRVPHPAEKSSWERMGKAGFLLHAGSVLGIVVTIFYLIYTHDYAYHYVWSHSSNELPVHFMISCFWEGQEGSFLLWQFWHSFLGLIILWKARKWRNGVLSVLSSIELILSSMLLGVYLSENWVTGLMLLMAIIPGLYFGYEFVRKRDQLAMGGNFHLTSGIISIAFVVLLLRNQLGYGWFFQAGGGVDGLGFWGFMLFALFYLGLFLAFLSQNHRDNRFQMTDLVAGLTLVGLALISGALEVGQWKLGSTPFILLKDVFSANPVYAQDPDFIPLNGSGLNPLLQNYWMVIHPPTLFLGFAATAIPFCFVIAGLLKGDYTGWMKPAMPWLAFSVMVLGVGIIMGGYWAYETLNFGGYWNWDPVENSSLVPWLCGVAALHTLLIYRKTKSYLKLSMLMIVGTFLLVLYSTFLTRSGILGDTSVHTFTDLGLSGQLLVLLGIYSASVIVAMLVRWKKIPQRADESKVWSAEFMLFIGIMVFIFSGLVITMVTSIPVWNSIFGT
ncbi:MAG: cytochrome c biogenesis protein CcsA, partial [Bacteroidota bacterium]